MEQTGLHVGTYGGRRSSFARLCSCAFSSLSPLLLSSSIRWLALLFLLYCHDSTRKVSRKLDSFARWVIPWKVRGGLALFSRSNNNQSTSTRTKIILYFIFKGNLKPFFTHVLLIKKYIYTLQVKILTIPFVSAGIYRWNNR